MSIGLNWIIFKNRLTLVVKNLDNKKIFDERIVKKNKNEYKIWMPYKSKLAAAIYNGLEIFPIKKDSIGQPEVIIPFGILRVLSSVKKKGYSADIYDINYLRLL